MLTENTTPATQGLFNGIEGYQTHYKHLFSDFVLPRSGRKPDMSKIDVQAEMSINYQIKNLTEAGAADDSYLCLRDVLKMSR